jgi:hypothetical protein
MTANRDLKNNFLSTLNMYYITQSSGSDQGSGSIIDTALYDNGILFSFAVVKRLGGDTFFITFRESDNPSMSGATTVPDEKIIGDPNLTLTTQTNDGDSLATLGLRNTKRYVQLLASGVAVIIGTIVVAMVNNKPNLLPIL